MVASLITALFAATRVRVGLNIRAWFGSKVVGQVFNLPSIMRQVENLPHALLRISR